MPASSFSITAFAAKEHGRGRNKYSMCSNNPALSTQSFSSSFREIQACFFFKKKKKKESAQPSPLPRCLCNNYSVHCCGHITQGRRRARQTTVTLAAIAFGLKYVASATENVHVLLGSGADCVRESGTSASFPIMAAALLPGPSSPLLFFGKRELWRQKQRREGLTQRRPHTTAAGRRAAASTSLLHTRRSSLTASLSLPFYLITRHCTFPPAHSRLTLCHFMGKMRTQIYI